MNKPFFSNNRSYSRRWNNGQQKPQIRSQKSSNNFTDNFADFSMNLHNSTMQNSRNGSFLSRSFSNGSKDHNASFYTNKKNTSDKPSFSSLFTSESKNDNNNYSQIQKPPAFESFPIENPTNDDDGIYLQISNLDQWYDETNLRNYLMNQLKPITPILCLNIETPSIAKIKVPSFQFAKQVVSHLHRKKIGHKRIFVSFMKDKTSAECSALRNKVAGLLKAVPNHQLPMSKFRELFQSRFKSSISILDLYRMPEICAINLNNNEEKIIKLLPETAKSFEFEMLETTDQHCAPYCTYHFKADKNKGWAEIEIESLPNVVMSVSQVQAMIHPLLKVHKGDIPIASLLYCLQAETKTVVQSNDRGVSLEHLVSCVPGVQIRNNDYGIKILAWRDEGSDDGNSSSKGSLNLMCGDSADNISKEVIELVKVCPKSTMMFSKFIPTYHNHFGKQCRVADYGCTKLIEMFEAMSSIVQVLGDGESRKITLTHSTQLRRFSTDVFKVLRSQPSKSLHLSMFPQAYLSTFNRAFDVSDYGVCDIEDLLDGLRCGGFIIVTKKRDESDDVCLYIQKRRQSSIELEKTAIFAGEVVELLRNAPQYSIPFRKFVRSYHYYFGYQCKLSDYGYLRLTELLEALSGIVEMDQNNEENRKVFLSRKVAVRIFAEQIHEVIKELAGQTKILVKVDDVLEQHKVKYGYQMQGSSLGYASVIDALKFVPYIELSSYENELWIMSHLDSEMFRQNAILACLALIDVGYKVPLSKFHSIFGDKYKFNINEKMLHAMKHAVEIDMVNGTKMISVTQTMKLLLHIANVLEQKKKMNIQEIKSIVKIGFNTTFNFGFPNISSLIEAYPDIFVILTGCGAGEKASNERCEFELNPSCPLLQSGLKTLLTQNRSQLPEEKPKMFYKPEANPVVMPPAMRCIEKPLASLLMSQQKFQPCAVDQQQKFQHYGADQQQKFQPLGVDDFLHRNIQKFSDQKNNPFMMNRGDVTMSQTMPTELVNQMMNCSCSCPQQQQHQKIHMNQFFDVPSSSQSLYERNLKLQHQHQMQSMKRDFCNSSGVSTGYSSSSSSSLSAYEANMQQQYLMMSPSASFHNRFDPPKPDTPPSKPLWLDPVWNCDGNFFDNRNAGANSSVNYGNPDSLKAFNFHVVSPFLSFKTMFTFDNMNPAGNNANNHKM